jgi:drug/metabolite transporter (DMT)-like permease
MQSKEKAMNKNNSYWLAFLAAVLSGLSVFVNSFGVKGFDATAYTLLKNFFAAFLILLALLFFGSARELLPSLQKHWRKFAVIALVGGGIPFVLFFQGLAISGGVKGSFIYRMLFAFSAVQAVAFLKEKPGKLALLGGAIALFGNFVLIGNQALSFGLGEFLVLAATLLWSFEWVYTKPLLEEVKPEIAAFYRLFLGCFVILGVISATSGVKPIVAITSEQLLWSGVTGVMLFAFTTTWYKGLKENSVTTATALLTLGGPITTALNFVFLGKFGFQEIVGMVLVAIGALLVAGVSKVAESLKPVLPRGLPWRE